MNKNRKFTDTKPLSWLVGGILAKGSITVLIGDSGLGKTSFALQLAHCVQAGVPFMKQPVKQGKVLFVEQDESPAAVHDKIKSMLGRCSTLNELEYYPTAFYPQSLQSMEQLGEASQGYALLVVDSLEALDVDANNSQAVRTAIRSLREIAVKNYLAVLLIHHLRKPSRDGFETTEERLAGSHGIKDSCDFLLTLYKHEGARVLGTTSKFRGRRTFSKILMSWSATDLCFRAKELVPPYDEER